MLDLLFSGTRVRGFPSQPRLMTPRRVAHSIRACSAHPDNHRIAPRNILSETPIDRGMYTIQFLWVLYRFYYTIHSIIDRKKLPVSTVL